MFYGSGPRRGKIEEKRGTNARRWWRLSPLAAIHAKLNNREVIWPNWIVWRDKVQLIPTAIAANTRRYRRGSKRVRVADTRDLKVGKRKKERKKIRGEKEISRCYSDWIRTYFRHKVHATCWEQRHVPWIMTNVISSLFSRLWTFLLFSCFEIYDRFVWETDKMEFELRVNEWVFIFLWGVLAG